MDVDSRATFNDDVTANANLDVAGALSADTFTADDLHLDGDLVADTGVFTTGLTAAAVYLDPDDEDVALAYDPDTGRATLTAAVVQLGAAQAITATGDSAGQAVLGGASNGADGDYSTVPGGYKNKATADYAFTGGGYNNQASGEASTVAAGRQNLAAGLAAAVLGGAANSAAGDYSTVPGGHNNSAAGDYSLAAGRRATAAHDGAFVWADSTAADQLSVADDTFTVRAAGGAYFLTGGLHARTPITITTASIALPALASGALLSNKGAEGALVLSLPPAAAGLNYCFYVYEAWTMTITPAPADQIHAAVPSGHSIASDSAGDALCLVAIDATDWAIVAENGSWIDPQQ